MSPSNPPPDRFQREIDDIIRLAERRLEKQSFSHRMRRSTRRLGGAMGGFGLRLPPAETLGGLGLACLMVSWFLTLGLVPIAIALRLARPLAAAFRYKARQRVQRVTFCPAGQHLERLARAGDERFGFAIRCGNRAALLNQPYLGLDIVGFEG